MLDITPETNNVSFYSVISCFAYHLRTSEGKNSYKADCLIAAFASHAHKRKTMAIDYYHPLKETNFCCYYPVIHRQPQMAQVHPSASRAAAVTFDL